MADYVGSEKTPVNAKADVEAVGCTYFMLALIAFSLVWAAICIGRIANAIEASNEPEKEAPIAQRNAE